MSERSMRDRSDTRGVAVAFVLLVVIAFAITGRNLDAPGSYYDEVIQAEPSVQFLAADGRPSAVPGARTIRLFGGWFPIVIQPYMGALKSQLLIPVFYFFGPSVPVLRIATVAMALIGLGFAMLFARETLGGRVAIVAGVLLAVDPSFLWTSRHDWGSFSLALLCRCAGLYFLTVGWRRSSMMRLFAGGLAFGLGVYNKIDFGVFVAAAGTALACTVPSVIGTALRSRGGKPLPAVAGFLVGAAPMIAGAGAILATTGKAVARQTRGAGDWSEKLHTFAATLDGSYFHELMISGGSFERMADVSGAASDLFGVAFVLCLVALGAALWRDRRRGALDRAEAFVWLATIAIAIGVFLTPRTVRIHHALTLYPFPQLVVAIGLVRLFSGTGARRLRRVGATMALVTIVAGSLIVNARTSNYMQTTGGKGRWSDAIGAYGRELSREPGVVVFSLDWGFDGPLRFAARGLDLVEPVWTLRRAHLPGHAWKHSGTPQHVYVTFDEDFAVFDFGPKLIAAARNLEPEDVTIREHLDREGDPAFVSIRFSRSHRLTYDGEFEVDLK